jgi:hypothetical protein
MENIEAMLCAYIEGDLDESGRAQIENHLKSHPQHRKLLNELTEMREMVRALPRVKAPMDVSESLHQKVERSMLLEDAASALPIRERGGRWPQVFAIAAILLLVSALCFIVLRALAPTMKPAVFTQAVNKFQGPEAQPMAAPAPANSERDELMQDTLVAKPAPGGVAAQPMVADKQMSIPPMQEAARISKSATTQPLPQSAVAQLPPQNTNQTQNVNQTRQLLEQMQQQQQTALAQLDLSAIRRRLQNSGFGVGQNANSSASTTLMVVNTSNPTATGQQITQFLNSNAGIQWNAVPEDLEGQNNRNAGGFGGGGNVNGATGGSAGQSAQQLGAKVSSAADVPAPAMAGAAIQPMTMNAVAGSQFVNANSNSKATTQPSSDVYVAHGLTAQQVDALRLTLTGPQNGPAVQVTVQAVQGLAAGSSTTGGLATTEPSVAVPKGVNAMGLAMDQAKGDQAKADQAGKGGEATSQPSEAAANMGSDLSSATTMPSEALADYGKEDLSQQAMQGVDAVIVLQEAGAGQVQLGTNFTATPPTTRADGGATLLPVQPAVTTASAPQTATPATQPAGATTQP